MHKIKAATIKWLAVNGRYREPTPPDPPMFKQVGRADVELSGWPGICGPPQLPREIRQKLGNAVVEITMQRRPGAVGFDPAGQDTNTFAAYHETEVARWKKFTGEIGMSK